MSLYADLEEFVQAHRPHGELTWWTTPPTPQGRGFPGGPAAKQLYLLQA